MANKTKNKKNQIVQKQVPLINNQLKKSFQIPQWSIYVVLTFTALIYVRATLNGFAGFDDDGYLFDNPYIKNFNFEAVKAIFSSFYLGNYHPLTTLTYLFEYYMYGLNPFPYHVLNVLIHLLNTLLVYKFVEKLSGQRFTALFVAALFALHPMHVESVAWISERKDVLYTCFYLGALLVYINYLESGFKRKHYWICLLLFLLSLLSKSAAVTLPVLMIAIDFYKNRKRDVKMFLEKLPFFALSLLFGVLALMSQKLAIKDVLSAYSVFDRMFLLFYSIAFYLVKLVAPIHLSAVHFYPDTYAGALPWYYYASLPFLLLLAWLALRPTKFRREKLFGVFFFLIVISIMLQIVAVGSAIAAERYTYVAYIGLFYIAGQWISKITKVSLMKTAIIISGLILFLFSYLTWDRIGVWKDGNVLFTDVVNKYPKKYISYFLRGNHRSSRLDKEGALRDYNKALQINPYYNDALDIRASILNDLGDFQGALRDADLSIKLDPTRPDPYNNRGMAYDGLGDKTTALRDYDKAIQIQPIFQKAYNNRGVLKATLGDFQGALDDINKSISLEPDDAKSYSNRANIKAMMKDYSGSIEDYSTALKLNPNDDRALFNRGLTKLNLNDTAGACEDFHKAYEMENETAGEIIKQLCK